MQEPRAQKIMRRLRKHGDVRLDPYYWMNRRDSPEVLAYLAAENAYAEAKLKPLEEFQESLFQELKSRYKKDEETLPYFFNGYWYIIRYEAGRDYPIFTRKKSELTAPEEILLDANDLAETQDYVDVGVVTVSPDNLLVAYTVDFTGDRIYTLFLKNLATGELLPTNLSNCSEKPVWSADSDYLFYITKDEALRDFQVWRHKIGTDTAADVLVYEERDETFDVYLSKSKSQEYLFLSVSTSTSDEHHFIRADEPLSAWQVTEPRSPGLEYAVDHYGGFFYLITNAGGATDFKLMKTQVENPGIRFWEEIIPHRPGILLEGFELFREFLVLEERHRGLLQICIISHKMGDRMYIPFDGETYSAYIGLNLDYDTHLLRYGFSSLTTPSTTLDYDMRTGTTRVVRQQEVMDPDFSPSHYQSCRLWAPSRDGQAEIPVSLVWHRDTVLSAETPLLLYAYGSYGETIDPSFSTVRLALLNRGFVYAIAHVRGGEYLGRKWYEDGKLLAKKNTFSDFTDAAKFLIKNKYSSPRHLYAMGGSAGGLLMGVVANEEPHHFNGIIAQVPFVDVVTTMLDDSIPLTTGEYDEWGDPNEPNFYHYMKSYSPYDNVKAQPYPNMLVTTGYHDSQVQYWEPAKWVAKLRDLRTDDHLLIFKTDMAAGHGGASGRFQSLREDALEIAFLCWLEGKT